MLASLSIADHELFERLIDAIFPQHLPAGSNGNTAHHNAMLIGQAIREKTVATVQACKEMLLEEPPERMTEFWGTVRLLVDPLHYACLLIHTLSTARVE